MTNKQAERRHDIANNYLFDQTDEGWQKLVDAVLQEIPVSAANVFAVTYDDVYQIMGGSYASELNDDDLIAIEKHLRQSWEKDGYAQELEWAVREILEEE